MPTGGKRQDVAQQTHESLGRVGAWRLGAAQWKAVAEALDNLERAWDAGNVLDLRVAVARLELAGPRLASMRIEDEPLTSPPEVRERWSMLMLKIADEVPDVGEADQEGAG
ncbi:CATRA system-associated protein [Streptomyces mirabilis]|uniref:CATRA system-associated protein n=1 Tax=Streptomyces mirabilis TaxID=68239 RepID=UPI00368A58A2